MENLIDNLKKEKGFDTWGSHLYLFERFFKVAKVKEIIEFGCGSFSTKYLSYHCDSLITVESEIDFLDEVSKDCVDRDNIDFYLYWPEQIDGLFETKPDLVFVDAKKNDRVFITQKALDEKTEFIVLHDIEKTTVYHWDRLVIPEGYYIYDCKDVPKQTRLLTTNKEVYDKILEQGAI